MIYAVGLILAMQTVIAWGVFRNGRRTVEAINLTGEIKVEQANFDKKVDGLIGKVDALDAKSDAEAAQVASLTQSYKEEINRLRAEHPDLDTSRLDELNDKLDAAAQRIGDIVKDEPAQTGDGGEKAQPAETVDPLEPAKEVPATSVETETIVTTKTESADGEAASEASEVSATATDTAADEVTAEAEATAATSAGKDAE